LLAADGLLAGSLMRGNLLKDVRQYGPINTGNVDAAKLGDPLVYGIVTIAVMKVP
jgi:hypothetical protein